MASIGNILAPASTIVAGSNQAGPNSSSSAATSSAANQNTANNAAAIGQAAVVSLSHSSKNRGASSGSEKRVDAAFDKEEIKSNEKKKDAKANDKTNAVDVSA